MQQHVIPFKSTHSLMFRIELSVERIRRRRAFQNCEFVHRSVHSEQILDS